MQIIVLGMHRAGTSLTTRLVNLMGAYVGPEGMMLPPGPDNPGGFWERRDVVDIDKRLLTHFHSCWSWVARFEGRAAAPPPPGLERKIRTTVFHLDAHRPWVIKDPRLCMTLGCWLPALECPVAVVAHRNPLEIARSLQARDGLDLEHGLALWEYHAVHLIRRAHALPVAFSDHAALLAAPVDAARALHDALEAHGVRGLRLPSRREVLAFVDPTLYRAREPDLSRTLTAGQRRLCAMLRGEVPFDPAVRVSDRARAVMERARPAPSPV